MTFFILGGILWLDVCLGFEPSLAQSKARIKRPWTDTLVKPPCLKCVCVCVERGGEARAPSLRLGKITGNLRKVSERRINKQLWGRFIKANWSPFFCGLEWQVDPRSLIDLRQVTRVNPRLAYLSAEVPK